MPHAPVADITRRRAKTMRRVLTDAELRLWNELRAHRLGGLSFRRQVPIAGFIVDFACSAKKLIVELDGSHHGDDEHILRDDVRTKRVEKDGWTILRFWNDDVLHDIDTVCLHIVTAAGLSAHDAGMQGSHLEEHHP